MREPGPRLGRGLAALLGETDTGRANEAAQLTRLDRLEPGPFQPRGPIMDAELEELAASIRAQGILQPLLVRPTPGGSTFQIIAGERRWRASRLAGLIEVPCYVRPLTDPEATVAALVENLQRVDLNPIEEAEGFRRLVDEFHLSQEQLGAAIGKSRSHVANLLRLLHLPPEVVGHVRAGTLTAGHARAALACPDPVAAANVMITRGLSVRQAEALGGELTQRPQTKRKRASSQPTDPDLAAVERDLAEQLGMQVAISFNGAGGALTIRYRTLDQLDYLLARLGKH